MIKVLVVDDEPKILRALRINLRARGYDVEVAACGAEALRVAATQQPELVVLDLGLPDLDGLDVIHGLRGWTAVPIIVLSGRAGSSDKVAALDAGDYVTKPFGVDELLARIRAVTRRTAGAGNSRSHGHDRLVANPRRPESAAPKAPSRYGSPRPNGSCWRSWSRTPGGWSASANCCRKCGDPSTAARPTISASTWHSCAKSWRTTPPTRVTCSPNPVWATDYT
jgi:CheY-like chemotaxis protein